MSGGIITSATHVARESLAGGGAAAVGALADRLADAAPAARTLLRDLGRDTTGPVDDVRRGIRALVEYQDVRSILTRDRAHVSTEDVRRLSGYVDAMRGSDPSLMQFPLPKRMGFGSLELYPDRRHELVVELNHLQVWSDRIEELGRHADLEHARMQADPNVTRATLADEVRAITSKPTSEYTTDDVRRLAVIQSMPGPKGLDLPPPRKNRMEVLFADDEDPRTTWAVQEFARMRIWAEQDAILRDPALTGDVLRREVMELAAASPDDVTFEDMVRLAAISRVDDARGVGLPAPAGTGLTSITEHRWLPSTRGRAEARQEFESLRIWREQLLLEADPNVTKQALERELLEYAVMPRSDVTSTELRRIAAIDGIRGAKRPDIAPAEDVRDFRWLAVHNVTPRWAEPAQVEMAKLFTTSDAALDVIRDRVARGERLDAAVIARLAEDGDVGLARVGLTQDDIRRMVVDVLASAGADGTTRTDVLYNLRSVQHELAERLAHLDGPAGSLRTLTGDLVDRNIARMIGEREDTYARHPDYAEVGRVVANLQLLRAMARREAPPAAAAATEILTW